MTPTLPEEAVKAPERIRVAQDAEGFWTCREAISGSTEYIRADLAFLSVQGAPANACQCTKIQQDETCPVGYPSLLCEICDGKGVVQPSSARELALEEAFKAGAEWCNPRRNQIVLYTTVEKAAKAYALSLSSPHHADAGKVEGDGWLPIESAPKDGTEIIYLTKYGSIGFCRYDFAINEDDDDCWWDLQADDEVYPKRWLPRSALPSAPASEGA